MKAPTWGSSFSQKISLTLLKSDKFPADHDENFNILCDEADQKLSKNTSLQSHTWVFQIQTFFKPEID